MPVPGPPPALGRGVVIDAGDPVPAPWRDAPVITVDGPAAVPALHDAWLRRRPVVIALAIDPASYRAPARVDVEPWRLDARFELPGDRLHFLTWANNYDARGGIEPVWWWSRKAARLGAQEAGEFGVADVVLGDGSLAWIDGGPRGPLELSPVIHAETVELGRLDVMQPRRAPAADLAPDQLAAVAHGAGPARIVAPAGSGKTRVLTERLRHLIVDRGIERDTVLAVAYNTKAKLEMESRTTDFAPHVNTLNALGYRLLGRPRVLEEREVREIVASLVSARRRRVNTDPIAPYLEGLTSIRLGLRDPELVEAERDDVPGLAAAFDPYRRALARVGAVDFDEQVYGAIELVLRDGEARRRAQACRHLLVDELQDLAPAHVLLLRLLAAPAFDVFGVGDDDQVIYGHQSADPGFLIDFSEYFPGAADHPLEVNYRCPVKVVDAARTLLSYNDRRVAKTLRPGPDAVPGDDALTVRLHPPELGASTVVEIVQSWLDSGVSPVDIAVLTRVNALLLPPQVALLEAGVPVASALPRDILDRTGVRAALAYLRLGSSGHLLQPADLREVLRRPSRGLPTWIEKWLTRPMDIAGLHNVADKLDDVKVAEKVRGLASDVQSVIDAVESGTTRKALLVIRDGVGLGGAMSLLDSSKGGQAASQLDDLEALVQLADLHPDVRTFESWLRGVLSRAPAGEGVTVATVHRVKGMEWKRVVVAGVTSGIVPHRLAEDVEEERRVLHVAITRCKHEVVILGDATRPSEFLGELDGSAPKRAPVVRRPAAATVPARKKKAEPVALSEDAQPVFDALRSWRSQRAKADKVPAYVVANDATLRAIATKRPASLVELSTVPGIGPTKLELYGDEVVAVVAGLE